MQKVKQTVTAWAETSNRIISHPFVLGPLEVSMAAVGLTGLVVMGAVLAGGAAVFDAVYSVSPAYANLMGLHAISGPIWAGALLANKVARAALGISLSIETWYWERKFATAKAKYEALKQHDDFRV